jgi:hypothetical protein
MVRNEVIDVIDGKYHWLKYPTTVQIETSNYCGPNPKYSGINCSYCYPTWNKLCKKDFYAEMSMEAIEYIQKDMAENMPRLHSNCQDCRYFLDGDPQNELRLPEILKSHDKLVGWLPTNTFSCGSKPERAFLFCDKNLDSACFTLSASNREIYKKVHRGDKFEQVIKTLHYVDEHRCSNQKIEVHYTITKDNFAYMNDWWELVGATFPDFKRVFSPLVINDYTIPSKHVLGNLTLEMQEEAISKINITAYQFKHTAPPMGWPCVLWGNGSINVHGDLLQCCCWGAERSLKYGDIKDYMKEGKSIKDFWKMRILNLQENDICSMCNLRHPEYKQRLALIQSLMSRMEVKD